MTIKPVVGFYAKLQCSEGLNERWVAGVQYFCEYTKLKSTGRTFNVFNSSANQDYTISASRFLPQLADQGDKFKKLAGKAAFYGDIVVITKSNSDYFGCVGVVVGTKCRGYKLVAALKDGVVIKAHSLDYHKVIGSKNYYDYCVQSQQYKSIGYTDKHIEDLLIKHKNSIEYQVDIKNKTTERFDNGSIDTTTKLMSTTENSNRLMAAIDKLKSTQPKVDISGDVLSYTTKYICSDGSEFESVDAVEQYIASKTKEAKMNKLLLLAKENGIDLDLMDGVIVLK